MKVTPGALRGDSCSKKEKVPATLQSVEIEGRAMSGSEVSLERILVLSMFVLALSKKVVAAVPVIVTARYVPDCNNFFCVDTTPTRKKNVRVDAYLGSLLWRGGTIFYSKFDEFVLPAQHVSLRIVCQAG